MRTQVAQSSIQIGIVLYPGVQMASVLGLTDLFEMANRVALSDISRAVPLLRVTHWQQASAVCEPVCVFDSAASSDSERSVSQIRVLILPPMLGNPSDMPELSLLASWLLSQHASGATLGSVCAGAFLLAQTKLLDHRQITTHWAHAEALQRRFPNVRIDTDRLVIDDGDIITAGGLMSWCDLGLRVIARCLGSTIMQETARTLLVDPPGREQRYYSVFTPNFTHGDAAILKLQHWLQATQAKEISLPILAAQANLTERTLLRRFFKATGMTTTEYCQRLRVSRARDILQFTNVSIDRVAWDVGYADAGAFRKVFARIVGLSPGDFRRRFAA